jgi:NAD(P)-dependent dehydrogenase (short-subunit alcohol dehydrogenase family)
MDINGHVAIVTSGGSGLGAKTLASLTSWAAVRDTNLDRAHGMAEKTGGIAIKCDVANAHAGGVAVAEARTKHGGARMLVYCAGIAPPEHILGRDCPMPRGDYERVIRTNLVGVLDVRLDGALRLRPG